MNRGFSRTLGGLIVLGATVATTFVLTASARAATLDGKQIFLDQKCNMCHPVSSAGITPTSKIKAPDLAGLAFKEDPAWLTKFLKKEAEKNGKKHIKPFGASDEELGAVIAWLQKQTKAADTK
jgi:mono/diheme cytochrome c family protein